MEPAVASPTAQVAHCDLGLFQNVSDADMDRDRGLLPRAESRRQLALLRSRLEHAVERGCDLAMVVTQPGSASQRNAERRGFRVAYTRIKWRLDPLGTP